MNNLVSKAISNCKIISNHTITPEYKLLTLDASFFIDKSKPGQFVMVKITDDLTTDPLLRIPLSIHDCEENQIKLLYRIIGNGTRLLSKLKIGERLNLLGPLGNGFDLAKFNSHATVNLIAGGCGIAPLYWLAKKLRAKASLVNLFFGVADHTQAILVKEFEELGVKVYLATDNGSLGFKGNVIQLFQRYLTTVGANFLVCSSGPKKMLFALAKMAKEFNFDAQLSFEEYMACGIGACRGCAIKVADGYQLCCQDGPVFDARLFD